ncbi:hypothetical protein FTUN_3469 [Frigoriglobus tundricola]|uniref:Uncharacterized protein n=1 Tax=Frigoriglobus tundricola TaxID=2774151 RepID=A0A6M5YPI7_9BACT|nr:hypothetical protein FTUN_3469 [Frigoriglobus tundricola]
MSSRGKMKNERRKDMMGRELGRVSGRAACRFSFLLFSSIGGADRGSVCWPTGGTRIGW